ncbi:hypothetical protein Hanom_Chr00s000002g01599611 [Helianthus anomalus]
MTPLLCPAPHLLCPASSAHAQGNLDKFEELDQLEKMEAGSAVSKQILSNAETRPDPLLPT